VENDVSKKAYIVIIIILFIVSGSLFFRSCVSGERIGFNRIRDVYNTIDAGIKHTGNLLSESITDLTELERINIEKDARIEQLESTIEELTESLIRITSELETEIATGTGAIERARETIEGIESIVNRIRETGQE
jgi:archaellum component FlaC